jgi:hypothetical protein
VSERERALVSAHSSLELAEKYAENATTLPLSVQQSIFGYGCVFLHNRFHGHESVCRLSFLTNCIQSEAKTMAGKERPY